MTAKENPTPYLNAGRGTGRLSLALKGRFVFYPLKPPTTTLKTCVESSTPSPGRIRWRTQRRLEALPDRTLTPKRLENVSLGVSLHRGRGTYVFR